jgi:hypothetical protein
MSRALETAPATKAESAFVPCDSAAHHSRAAAWLLAAALVALGACGTVDVAPSAKDGAGGNGAAGAGAPDGAAGGGGSFSAAGGAGGATLAAGSSGGTSSGGAGGGASSGSAGAGGQGGEGNHPWTAPVCSNLGQQTPCHEPDGGFVELTVDGGVPGSGINSWRCETNCSLPSSQQVPCTGSSNHTYCVATCEDCRR